VRFIGKILLGLGAGAPAVDAYKALRDADPLGVLNLNPIRARATGAFSPAGVAAWSAAENPPRRWMIAVVGLRSGRLRYATETGEIGERGARPALMRRDMDPQCQPALDRLTEAKEELRAAQAALPETHNAGAVKVALVEVAAAQAAFDACVAAHPPIASRLN